MRVKRIAVSVFAVLLLASSFCMAEDMQFVDAKGSTGYYVDVASIVFEGEEAVNARIAVKKAAMNRMFLYTMHFDAKMHTYQILDSQVVQYDTREVLESKGGTDVSRPYGMFSPMNSIVEYIYSLRKEKK